MSAARLLAIRDVRIYLIGQAFSLLGDTALWQAMGIWVKTLTGSSGAAGLVFFFFTAPALLAPVSGLLVDRMRRKPLLIAVNAGTGGCVLLLLLVRGAGQVWIIYLVMALYGLTYSILRAAESALLRSIVPVELLPDANGALRTVQEMLTLVGPLVGSGLFLLVGGHIIAILDAVTFVVPVLSLLSLRIDEPGPAPRTQTWRTELTAGLRYIARTAVLRQVVIAGACALAVFGFSETIIFAITSDGLHRGPAFVGVLLSIQGGGAIVGGSTAAALIRRLGEGRLIGAGALLIAGAALLELPPALPAVVVGAVLFGVGVPWLAVAFTSLIQRVTPPELQGRTYAAADALVTTPQTISIAVGAVLVGVTGYRALLLIMAGVMTATAAFLLSRPEQRISASGTGR